MMLRKYNLMMQKNNNRKSNGKIKNDLIHANYMYIFFINILQFYNEFRIICVYF
jgi:hypothetical protein